PAVTALAVDALTQVARLVVAPEKDDRKLVERLHVDFALEFDDGVQRHPILAPAPGVEFGVVACAQADVAIAADQPQQEPDLLLALVVPPPFAPNVVFGDVVTQPVSSAPQYADMFRSQTHFLVEFSIHGLHRAFAVLDAALRELPRVFPDPLAPKDFVLGVDENNADVGAVAFAIQHGATPRIQYNCRRLYVSDGPFADLLHARIQ